MSIMEAVRIHVSEISNRIPDCWWVLVVRNGIRRLQETLLTTKDESSLPSLRHAVKLRIKDLYWFHHFVTVPGHDLHERIKSLDCIANQKSINVLHDKIKGPDLADVSREVKDHPIALVLRIPLSTY